MDKIIEFVASRGGEPKNTNHNEGSSEAAKSTAGKCHERGATGGASDSAKKPSMGENQRKFENRVIVKELKSAVKEVLSGLRDGSLSNKGYVAIRGAHGENRFGKFGEYELVR